MTGISTTARLNSQVDRLTTQQTTLETLAMQLATGKKTQEFSGLGDDTLTSIRTRASFKANQVFQDNISSADRKMQLMLQSTKEIKSQSENLSGQLVLFSIESTHQKGDSVGYVNPLAPEGTPAEILGMSSAEPSVEFQTMQDLAENLYKIVTDLLNVKDGDSYLLSGADTGNKPLNDSGLLDSAMTDLIAKWKDGTIGNNELIADLTSGDTSSNPDAINDTTVGFNSNLSSDNVGDISVRATETLEVDYTVKANEDPFRDILVGLAFLKNASLGPIADAYIAPNEPPAAPDVQGAPGATVDEQKENFFKVYDAVAKMTADAIDGIDAINGRVETARARINDLNDAHKQEAAILSDITASVEHVNLDQVAVEISSVQTRLQASYAVSARVQELSLVNFL